MASETVELRFTATDQSKAAFNSVRGALNGLGEQLLSVRGLLAGLGTYFSASFVSGLVKGAIDAESHMADLAVMAGTTASQFSKLEIPARTSGASLDMVAQAVSRLNQAMGTALLHGRGGEIKGGLLEAMGIDVTKSRDTVATMGDVARALMGMKDPAVADYVANQLLGESFYQLKPFLQDLIAAGELHATVTDEQAKRAKELTDQWALLGFRGTQAARTMTEHLMPALQDITAAFSDAGKGEQELANLGDFLGTGLKLLTEVALRVADGFYGVGHAIAQVAATANLVAHGEFRAAAEAWKAGNDDVAKHTATTDAIISALWKNTASNVKQAAATVHDAGIDNFGGAPDISGAERAVRAQMDFQAHYAQLVAAAQGLGTRYAAAISTANALATEAEKQHLITQEDLIRQLAANEDAKLAVQILSLKQQEALAIKKHDFAKVQATADAIAAANAQRVANQAVTQARLASMADDTEWKRRLATELGRIQLANMTEAEQLRDGLIQKQLILDDAHANGLLSDAAFHQQRELLELNHQAALGDVVAKGELDRRRIAQLSMSQQLAYHANFLGTIVGEAATHNKQMFELNKLASLGTALVKGWESVQNAYAWGSSWGGPFGGAAMAAIAAAATAVNVRAIQGAQFGGGAAPVSIVNPSTGLASASAAPQASPVIGPPSVAQQAAPAPKQSVELTFIGQSFTYEQIVDQVIPQINAAAGNGVDIKVRQL